MAAVAVRRCPGESSVYMAGIAGDACMGTGQRKLRQRVVIKLRARPADRRMTNRALLGKSGTHVIRIFGVRKILDMTAETIHWSSRKPAARVTCRAIQLCVCSRKREAGKSCVVELGAKPAVHAGVTLLACKGEF